MTSHHAATNVNTRDASVCNLKIMSTNIRSLRNKVDSLVAEISLRCPNVVAVQETWLCPMIPEQNVEVENFSMIRKDRGAAYGGVAFYIHSNLGWSIPDLNLDPDLELLCIDVHSGSKTTRICNVYRPDSNVEWYAKFRSDLELICRTNRDLFIVGDFNRDFLTVAESRPLRNLFHCMNLEQHIDQPTRFGAGDTRNSCLDLFVSRRSNNSIVHNVMVAPPYNSDHCSVIVQVGKAETRTCTVKTEWVYREGDYASLSSAIDNADWSCIDNRDLDADGAAQSFCDTFDSLLTRHIPTKTYILRPRDKDWMTGNIRRRQRKRDRLHNKARLTDTPTAWVSYRKQRNLVNSLVRAAKRGNSYKLIERVNSMTHSTSDWWKIVKTCTSPGYQSIPTLVTKTGSDTEYHTDDKSRATVLNDLFTEVTCIDDDNVDFPDMASLTDSRLDIIQLSTRDVTDAIASIPANKSPGPDNISPYLLHQINLSIAPVLVRLFNRSLQESKFPSVWKRSDVIPIHKKGERSDPCNYRPISLTSILSKVLEKAVAKYLLSYLTSNNLIYKFQSGFLQNHSPAHQLTEICHHVYSNLKDKAATTIVFADISRAFDRLSHRGLYRKLDLYGLSNGMKDWLLSFLTNREQRTRVGGTYSSWSQTRGGVAQGSVLGPICFLLMINDLPSNLTHDVRLFADDTSIIFTHPPSVDITDTVNDEMTRLQDWADTWLIELNPTKTKCMHITSARIRAITPNPKFRGTPIEIVHSHKHLGLVLNDDMTWTDHLDHLTTKVSKRIGILRSLKSRLNRSCLRTIYVAHIRSILEYCGVVWDGCTTLQDVGLERLQTECLRIITGLPLYCRLNHLYTMTGLDRLSVRRRRQRLVLLYKAVVLHRCPQYFLDLLPVLRHDVNARNMRNLNTFYLNFATTSAKFLRSCIPRTLDEWNKLPLSARTASSLSSFKQLIRPPSTSSIPYIVEQPRYTSIQYTRLKFNCSALNSDLFDSNLVPSSTCQCNTGPEDLFHYLYNCPFYDTQRARLMEELDNLGLFHLSIPVLFDCGASLPTHLTPRVQSAVFRYIQSTRRFWNVQCMAWPNRWSWSPTIRHPYPRPIPRKSNSILHKLFRMTVSWWPYPRTCALFARGLA